MRETYTRGIIAANRNYKDTLFRMIFDDKASLLSLYNAVNGTDYSSTDELEIVTLENAIYMNMKNDLAFLIDFSINLYEHQSTRNPNMPLRNLFYIAKEYEKLVQEKALYASTLVKIPTPIFLVFYNGSDRMPEKQILKLSDAYERRMEEPELELKVTVLNIGMGNNQELLGQCRMLKEYMQYVERVRKNAGCMPLEEAVEIAVNSCIQDGILADFLVRYKSEAINMSIFEYNEEKELELLRQAEFAAGEQQGLQQGMERGIRALVETCEEVGVTKEDIIRKIQQKFSLPAEDAQVYLKKYWSEI